MSGLLLFCLSLSMISKKKAEYRYSKSDSLFIYAGIKSRGSGSESASSAISRSAARASKNEICRFLSGLLLFFHRYRVQVQQVG